MRSDELGDTLIQRQRLAFTIIIGVSVLLGGCGLVGVPSDAPSGLIALPRAGHVTLEWHDNNTGEVGFEVYRAAGAGAFWPYDKIGPNKTVWTDDDVKADVSYRYKVRAQFSRESSFPSAFSNIVAYSWRGIEESDEPDSYPAVPVTIDGVHSTVAVSNEMFIGSSVDVSISSTTQPRGLREDISLVAPGITFSVPKNQLDLASPGGRFLVFPRWDVQEGASSAYVWLTIATRGEPVEFPLPYDTEHPDEPVTIHASWLAELEDEFGLGDQVTISVFPVTQSGQSGSNGILPQVVNQDFGLFKLDVADVATDTDLKENCDANRAVFNSGLVGKDNDRQDIGDRIPLVLVHGWQVLGNEMAGANPFDNGFKDSKFAPHVCAWLDFIDTFWIVGAGQLFDLTSKYALYTFSYDTDKHIIENAEELDAYLESAFGDRPAVIVSHSMGGMVASTVMRMIDERDATPSISNIISFGSPYRGTPALACVEQTTLHGVPVCSRAQVASDVSGSYVLTSVIGLLLRFHGTLDLASEVGTGKYLLACEEVSGLIVECTRWAPGIGNPFLVTLNETLPVPETHHSLVGELDWSTAKCLRWRWLWKSMGQALDCTSRLIHEAYGYSTDGIVPMQSAFFSDPFSPGEPGTLPHDVFAGVNHMDLHHTSGPLFEAMRLLRDLARDGSGGGDIVLTGHTGPITSASFTPDGERIITTSEDTTARVWDATTGALLFTTDSHTGAVNDAGIWADGSTIMTGSSDGFMKQWDAAGKEMWSSNYKIGIYSMDISLTGRYFAAGVGTLIMYMNPRPLVYLINLDQGTDVKQLGITALEGFYRDVMFSGDGTLLVTALSGVVSGAANVWDTATGTVKLELEGTFAVRTAAISRDGSRALAVSTVTGDVAVWDVQEGKLLYEFDPPSTVNDAVFSPDGTTILVACKDGSIRLYDAVIGTLITTIPTGMLSVTVANYSPDGSRFLVGSEDGEVIAGTF